MDVTPPAGRLALRLHLWRRAALASAPPTDLPLPAGQGPVVHIHVSEVLDSPASARQIIAALLGRRADLRFVVTGAMPSPDCFPKPERAVHIPLPRDPASVREVLAHMRPAVLLVIGDQLPASLISGSYDADVPVILSETRLVKFLSRSSWRGAINRGLMSRIERVLVPDLIAAAAARQLGALPERVQMIGPITEVRQPPHVNEAERRALAQILRGRHIWLAAAPTLPECRSVLAAHNAALHHNHRALLILAALPPQILPQVQAEITALGLDYVMRSDDQDPEADDQVLIADEDDEMGLWYRLASVCFMGGTLMRGEGAPPRHPFEPASLGSAIIHGPIPGPYPAEWNQLGSATAARFVTDEASLTKAAADLTAPDQAAILAQNAWSISTGGAEVLRRITDAVFTAMESHS